MQWKFKVVLAILVLVAPITERSLAMEPRFKLHDTWKLGGEGSWDYLTVDAKAHLLYIARLDRVMVVDVRTGKLVTEIPALQHAHGIAFNTDEKTGYISDGGAGTILVFDRSTFKIKATIPAGKNPDSVLYEPTRHLVFAFNGLSKNATVIDAATNQVVSTIAMPGKPEFSVTDGNGNIFVNIEDSSAVLRIDAAKLSVTATWPLIPGKGPSGLAIDTIHHRLFSVCDNNKMIILDSQTGKLVTSLPIGEGADAVSFDAVNNMVFSSNGESGTMSIVRALASGNYAIGQTVATKLGARTIAVDSSTATVYTVSSALGPRPPASPSNPKRRQAVIPGSFIVLAFAP